MIYGHKDHDRCMSFHKFRVLRYLKCKETLVTFYVDACKIFHFETLFLNRSKHFKTGLKYKCIVIKCKMYAST